MARSTKDDERKAFEAWYDAKESNQYVVGLDVAWGIWQAGRDELRTEVERLKAAAMKLDGYWISNTYDPITKNVTVRESAFAELRDLLGLKQKTYD